MTGGVRLAVWSSFLALSLRLLHGAAFGHLSVPLGSLDELGGWAEHTAPSVVALSVVRLAALAATWYLAAATVLAVVADVAGWRRAALVVAALSPRVVRRLASRSAGVGLAAGALLAVAPMPTRLAAAPAHASTDPADDPSPPTATMTRLPPTPGGPAGTATPSPADDPPDPTTAPSRSAPGTERPPTATMSRLPATRAEPASPDRGDGQDAELWTVAPGDSFWSIADEILADSSGYRADDDHVSRYWHQLITANRDRLLDPANPDLLVPGHQLELPPPA